MEQIIIHFIIVIIMIFMYLIVDNEIFKTFLLFLTLSVACQLISMNINDINFSKAFHVLSLVWLYLIPLAFIVLYINKLIGNDDDEKKKS